MTSEIPAAERPRCRSLTGFQILGTGSYVPEIRVTNSELEKRIPGCDPDWLVKQTGIRERRHALPHEATSDLCFEAARRCLASTSIDRKLIDSLIVATVTSDMSFPSTACLVQERLGLRCSAYDLSAGCAGFLYALVQGATGVASGISDYTLVVGGDCMSRVSNPADMKTYPLLGDGAGAVLLCRGEKDQGLLSFTLGADGSGAGLLTRKACGSRLPPTPDLIQEGAHFLQMDGRSVFTWAVGILCDTIQDVLNAASVTPDQVKLYIPHQANIRIINAALDVIGIPRQSVMTNLERYGNTSAASVPLALDEAVREGRVCTGDLIVLSGFGAGLAWGTGLLRW